MSNPDPTPQPDPLAVALSKLDPAPHGFDWNALMFAAGRESKARALVFWRIAAGACAVAACGFALATAVLVVRPRERVVYVERVTPQKVITPPAAAPEPVPVPLPLPPPAPAPKPQPVVPVAPTPSSSEPAGGWVIGPAPEPGAAARWFNFRNEVLTVGLGVLPDTGPKLSPPRPER